MNEPIRVLLVDDNEVNLDVLGRRLERKGCVVVAVTSGRSALVALEEDNFDAVVLDLRMPEMTGHEVLREIRALRTQVELPVIMATAETDPDEMVQALEGGANDYVTKPIDANVLLARLRAQLRAKATAPPAPRPPIQVSPVASSVGVGATIHGRYRLDELLGSGGFGSVYRARHLKLDTDVALKMLHPHLMTSSAIKQRFELEGISTCRVRHPNAVQVLDAGATDGGVPYLVMELLEGESLQAVLERQRVLRFREAAEVLRALCEVLEEAHRVGIIHRDVKPANVMLSSASGARTVKVLDFGIAKFIDREKQLGLTGDGVVGTPLFMSPEALLGRQTSPASDVFSVGVTAYLMLVGEPPHGPPAKNPFEQAIRQVHHAALPLSDVRKDLPAQVSSLIMLAIAREPELRPELADLRAALDHWAERFEEPVWPPELSGIPTTRRPLIVDAPTVHLADVASLPVPDSGLTTAEAGESGERMQEGAPRSSRKDPA